MRVLIVDDNTSITCVLEKYLTIKGFEVRICNDGLEGLKLIQSESWDKILLDLSMPEFSGFDVIDSLERNTSLKNKDIVLYTATHVPEHVVEDLLSRGIKSFLKKPCSLTNVVEAISV